MRDVWLKVLDLFERSMITQSILTLGIVGTYAYMVVAGLPTPQLLDVSVSLIFGFFFGSKVGHSAGEVKAIAKIRGEERLP